MSKYLFIIFMLIPTLCFGGADCKGDAGNDDMIIYSSDLGISAYPFTMCVKWNPTASAQNIVASLHNSAAADNYYYLEINATTNVPFIVARNTTFYGNDGTTDISSGIHTVCGVWAGNTDRKLYVDGGADEVQGAITSVTFNAATNQFSVCGSDDSTPTSNAQIVSEIAVWSVELTEAQSAQYHNAKMRRIPLQIQPANLLMYSPLDDYADGTTSLGGNTFRDESGNGNTGTMVDTDGDSIALAEGELSYP